jgi:hypothetical protein
LDATRNLTKQTTNERIYAPPELELSLKILTGGGGGGGVQSITAGYPMIFCEVILSIIERIDRRNSNARNARLGGSSSTSEQDPRVRCSEAISMT